MTCTIFKEVAHDYFLEHLPPEEVRRADEHVAQCNDCQEFLRICRELSCREFVEFLNDYVDGNLDPERRAVFERHLSICPDCVNYLDSYRRVSELSVLALGKRLPAAELPMPDGVLEDLVRAVLEARRAAQD